MVVHPPAIDLNQARLIIFDLDGTLYADTRQFAHYASLLREHVPRERQQEFDRDYAAAVAGRHPLTIGRIYDYDADLILAADRHLQVTQGWRWDGTPVPTAELAGRYPEPLRPDTEHVVTVGDHWWLPPACARHHGARFGQEPFLQTRSRMLSPGYRIHRIPGLQGALVRLHAEGKRLTVCSNSPDGDVQLVLARLGLADLVDQVYPGAGKPAGAVAAYSALAAACGAVGAAVLVVGDNYMNDIAPAEALGFQTLLINPLCLNYPQYQGPQVKSLTTVLPRRS